MEFDKTITAKLHRGIDGDYSDPIPTINPGDWFGRTWIVGIDRPGIGGLTYAVEADSASDAIDEFVDSEHGRIVIINDIDIVDYDAENMSYAGNNGHPVDLDDLSVECLYDGSSKRKATYWIGNIGPMKPDEFAENRDSTMIKAIADHAYDRLELDTRTNGDTFWKIKKDSDPWITDLIHAAHGEMMPDDWRYRMIRDVLYEIANCDDDLGGLIVEPSIYSSDLWQWAASHSARRSGYCEESWEDSYKPETLEAIISDGQSKEYDEITSQVMTFIKKMIGE